MCGLEMRMVGVQTMEGDMYTHFLDSLSFDGSVLKNLEATDSCIRRLSKCVC
jgi:hypothetical protein